MKNFFAICLLALFTSPAFSRQAGAFSGRQEDSLIKGSFLAMDVDLLGNIYAISRDGQLKKYSTAGDSLAGWNNVKTFGNPTSIDVSNPMRILVYFRPYATVVILDHLLVQRNVINLRLQHIFKVASVANSYDNNIWLFDEQDFRIKKVDDQGQVISEGADWRMLFPETPDPSSIADMHNQICLYDTARGIYLFDYYGSFKKNIPLTGLRFFGVNGNNWYGILNDEMIIADPSTQDKKRLALVPSEGPLADLKFRNDYVYLLDNKGIHIRKASNF